MFHFPFGSKQEVCQRSHGKAEEGEAERQDPAKPVISWIKKTQRA